MENMDPKETVAMETMTADDYFNETAHRILNISWFLLLIGALLMLVVNLIAYYGWNFSDYWFEWPLSYLLGGLTNILNFIILKLSLSRPKVIPKAPLSSGNYLLRMALYVLVSLIGYKVNFLSVIPILIGFYTVRGAIFIYSFHNRG